MQHEDLLRAVKAATRTHHERLEAVLPLTSNSITFGSYKETLQAFLGLFDPIENALMASGLPEEVDFKNRRRTRLLERDLMVLGLSEKEILEIPRFSTPPCFGTITYSLGVLYVLEGSRLGGQYVAKLLHDRLGLSKDGCSFFSSDGAAVGALWNKFCSVARSTVTTATEREEFMEGAKLTFISFEQWVMRSYVPIS